MSYKLYIDSSDNNKIAVKLYKDSRLLKELNKSQLYTSQILLPLIAELCRRQKIKLEMISEIEVYPGPGSYTGLKVGVAVANALGWFLKIPVNGKLSKPAEPVYQ